MCRIGIFIFSPSTATDAHYKLPTTEFVEPACKILATQMVRTISFVKDTHNLFYEEHSQPEEDVSM